MFSVIVLLLGIMTISYYIVADVSKYHNGDNHAMRILLDLPSQKSKGVLPNANKSALSEQCSSYQNKVVMKYCQDFDLPESQIKSLQKSQYILHTIRENCMAQNLSVDWNFWNNYSSPRLLIAKPENRILYGSNPKTGSTSFKRFLFCIDGICDDMQDFHYQGNNHYSIVDGNDFFKNDRDFDGYVKIMGIRNPIVRLMSAFRDKQLRNKEFFKPSLKMSNINQFRYFISHYFKEVQLSLIHISEPRD